MASRVERPEQKAAQPPDELRLALVSLQAEQWLEKLRRRAVPHAARSPEGEEPLELLPEPEVSQQERDVSAQLSRQILYRLFL